MTDFLKAVALFLGVVIFACAPGSPEKEIRIGGIFDLTGTTREIGVPYADGIRGYVDYINEKGGINGRRVILAERDYGYLIPKAEMVYTKLVSKEKVRAILGWGTGDTEQLRPLIARDRIPFMSASYSVKLTDIRTAPYNFLIGVTYSDQMRILLGHILDQWKEPGRKPKVAFIYCDNEFGRSPISDGRSYAASHGIEAAGEEIVTLDAREAREQLLRIKEKGVDFAVIQETTWAASVILKDARRLGLATRFMGLNWCADEKLIALAGDAAEGFVGAMPFVFTDQALPGIREITAYTGRKGIRIEGYILRYIQGWTTARVMLEGVRMAGNDVTGEGIRKGLESIRNLDTGGITAPVTFTPENHRGCTKLRLARVKDGRWQIISGFVSGEGEAR